MKDDCPTRHDDAAPPNVSEETSDHSRTSTPTDHSLAAGSATVSANPRFLANTEYSRTTPAIWDDAAHATHHPPRHSPDRLPKLREGAKTDCCATTCANDSCSSEKQSADVSPPEKHPRDVSRSEPARHEPRSPESASATPGRCLRSRRKTIHQRPRRPARPHVAPAWPSS